MKHESSWDHSGNDSGKKTDQVQALNFEGWGGKGELGKETEKESGR